MSTSKEPIIMMAESDIESVLNFINAASPKTEAERHKFRLMKEKIANRVVCENTILPTGYIGLNTQFALKMPFGFVNEVRLVLPPDANNDAHKLSVFSNLGRAIFGHKIGDKFDYSMSANQEMVEITDVLLPKKHKRRKIEPK